MKEVDASFLTFLHESPLSLNIPTGKPAELVDNRSSYYQEIVCLRDMKREDQDWRGEEGRKEAKKTFTCFVTIYQHIF